VASPEPAPAGFFRMRPLTARERLVLTVLFLILYSVGFVMLVYRPFTERVAELETELASEMTRLENARTILHRLNEIEQRIADLTAQMRELNRLIPGDNRAAQFLYYCWEWERSSGARVRNIVFQPPSEVGNFQEYAVTFTVEGSYQAHVEFLAGLEAMDRLVRVDSMTLAPAGEGSRTIAAHYAVHLFVDPGKAAEAAQETPGEGFEFDLDTGRDNPFSP